jgi:glucosamine--fructose-6-phosphate aminotransferase (isomerizing)
VKASYQTDLLEQPSALARLLDEGRLSAEAFAARVRRRRPAFAVLAARGTSDNAARYGQYLLGVRHGLVAALATPSVFTRYHATPGLAEALVLGISQSGQSPDIVAVVAEGRRQGAVTAAITNDPASPLALAAEVVIPIRAGPERAVAATKTYTSQLMAFAMLSAALGDDPLAWDQLRAVPDLVARTLDLNAERVAAAARFRRSSRLVVLGRGFNMSTAFEIALKVKETSGVMADPYSGADFLHGPVALLGRGLPVMVVASAASPFGDLDESVLAVARERRARVVAISDSPSLLERAEVGLPMAPGAPEWLSPLLAVLPGQLWAQALALSRGLSVDAPRALTKVTLTR